MVRRKAMTGREGAQGRGRGPEDPRAGLPNRRPMGKLRTARPDDKDSSACPNTLTRVIATTRPRSQAPGPAIVGG